MTRKISWEYYYPDDFKKSELSKIKDELDPEEDADEIEQIDSAQTFYTTPMGIIVKDDSMNPIRRIEHWLCHTNFNINLPVVAVLDTLEGVETITVVTRYQMIIGFGRLFEVSEVKKNIASTLINLDTYPKAKLKTMMDRIKAETFLGDM